MKIASYVQLYHGLQNYQTILMNVELILKITDFLRMKIINQRLNGECTLKTDLLYKDLLTECSQDNILEPTDSNFKIKRHVDTETSTCRYVNEETHACMKLTASSELTS